MTHIVLSQHESIRVTLENSDGEFCIAYDVAAPVPKAGIDGKDKLLVYADLPDTAGRAGVVYCEVFGETAFAEDTATEPATSAADDVLVLRDRSMRVIPIEASGGTITSRGETFDLRTPVVQPVSNMEDIARALWDSLREAEALLRCDSDRAAVAMSAAADKADKLLCATEVYVKGK
jgi:hypothetical protein